MIGQKTHNNYSQRTGLAAVAHNDTCAYWFLLTGIKQNLSLITLSQLNMQKYDNDNHYHYVKLRQWLMTLNSFPLLKF